MSMSNFVKIFQDIKDMDFQDTKDMDFHVKMT